ncbi:MAG: carbamoyltransferase [Planctomycetes bacterium]|nr:carbamoyltransferase [Planctomycetota bacterium]MCB9936539.1 carbamoyltransferase [Planctomycetota bacterium]
MLVLGINAYHADAAAVLYADGRLVAAVEEERLNRIKHCAGFPALAVAEVLRIGGVSLADVDEVAIARDSTANLRKRLAYVVRNLRNTRKVAGKRLADRAGLKDLDVQLAEACGVAPDKLKAPIRRVEHHLAHAASAFLPSPFERAAILTLDGFGDFASALWGVGEGGDIKVLGRVTYPHSLGILYTAAGQFIGFDRYGDEGKVMGLAPYGEPAYAQEFERLLRFTDEGFELELSFFNHHTEGVATGSDEYGSPSFAPLYTRKWIETFGEARTRGAELTQRDKDIAASLQQRLEQAFIHLARLLHAKTGLTELCLAGGVALNGVANGKLLEHTPFKRIWVQPAAGDDGTALGAAAWQCARAGLPRFEMQHANWGSSFSDEEITATLREAGVETPTPLDEDELCAQTARLIAEGNVVGWFQGAMEWGPRALGNRSIVAHPGHPRMKEILNARIKQREPFRPFAPSIKAERLHDYFESDHPSPFMLMVYRTRPEKYAELQAVDHVDHTGRVQTVTRESNEKYWKLIDAFEKQTGTPVVLNTSFNENEPIVCTPREALECFLRTKMDAVVLGDRLVTRRAEAPAVLEQSDAAHR